MQAIVPDVCPWMTESFGDFPTEGAGVRRNLRLQAMLGALVLALVTLVLAVPMASAQDLDDIVSELERSGYYIEPGADATESEMRSLVDRGNNTAVAWYYVVLSGPAEVGYAATIRDAVRPTGNVLLHSVESDSQGAFDQVDFATGLTRSIEERALAAFDTNWSRPVDYMVDVVTDFTAATSGPASAGSEGSSGSSSGSASSVGGFPWRLVVILVVIGGGLWFMSRRGKRKKQGIDLETAQKIRAELQTEIDELANDVLVLSGPVDLSDKPQAIEFYREATDTYLDISAEIPDMEELEHADLGELSDIGARVAHARWQMDAAEAILDGEPLPEKPKVEPPPPPTPPQQRTPQQRQQGLPQRAPRPRMPYSPSRRRSGGGLLDILIAGAGMAGSSRGRSRASDGGVFGGGTIGAGRSRQAQPMPRAGGGVFGGSSRYRTANRPSSRSSTRRSSSSTSSSSSSSRRTSSSRSTSKRRRR